MTRQEIRRMIRQAREDLGAAGRRVRDERIRERLYADPAWKAAGILITYLSWEYETDTWMIIRDAMAEGKTVYAPRITDRQAGRMEFYLLEEELRTASGSYGIPEPVGDRLLPEDCADQHTLFLMPGVAFSENRDRIGYGGGFYDRYLERRTDLMNRVALCYDCQVTDAVTKVPLLPTDIRPDRIITETRTIGSW